MAGEQSIDYAIILGTGTMLFMSLMVIVFVIFYQRKMFKKQNLINQIKIDNQRNMIKAEIDIKEREQKRIAQELHDDIGASLSSMRFIVTGLDPSIKGVPELESTLSRTTQKVRQISNDLLPHVLSELGIKDALSNLVNNLKFLPIEFTYTSDNNKYNILEKDMQLALFRVVQELITNIMKHAEATHVTIDLSTTERGIVIVIEDNGNGIIPEQDTHKSPTTLGLKNIQSRLQYLGGSIKREKNLPKGTKVTITKPLI